MAQNFGWESKHCRENSHLNIPKDSEKSQIFNSILKHKFYLLFRKWNILLHYLFDKTKAVRNTFIKFQ